jgi:hypothetical protein
MRGGAMEVFFWCATPPSDQKSSSAFFRHDLARHRLPSSSPVPDVFPGTCWSSRAACCARAAHSRGAACIEDVKDGVRRCQVESPAPGGGRLQPLLRGGLLCGHALALCLQGCGRAGGTGAKGTAADGIRGRPRCSFVLARGPTPPSSLSRAHPRASSPRARRSPLPAAGVMLPYPPNAIGLEVAFVFFYMIIESWRLHFGAGRWGEEGLPARLRSSASPHIPSPF